MPEIQSVLIVANSARMLAQLASNLGYCVWVIDCYADCDTHKLAKKCIRVNSLALDQVKKAFAILKTDFKMTHVVYGSGLERFKDSLAFLQQNLTVIGNTLDVFLSVQNKLCFFSRLSDLQIPYPEVSFQPPVEDGNWLTKPMHGEGGVGIEKYKGDADKLTSCFWQRYREGISMSVLFVADGIDSQLLGFHKQLSTRIDKNEFIFSGIISQPDICDNIRLTLNLWVARLVKEFILKGVNSLDFIVSGKQCYALEVNPRPSASMQLYTEDLLLAHINSFLPGKSEVVIDSIAYRAYKIIYAKTDCFIKESIHWPEWIVDIPCAGSNIHIGMPICSIIASGTNEQQVEEILLIREKKLSKLLQ
jgi:methenyltetrahydromethanopterin cyclohydrolase